MSHSAIPKEIQAQVLEIVGEFNRKTFPPPNWILSALFGKAKQGYLARFKGKYLYLDRTDHKQPTQICRLTWNGAMNNWDFAIFKYSRNTYDPEEWMFPGQELVDGTIVGAMKAGLKAYPK